MNFLSKALLFVLGIGADVISVTSGSAGVAGNVSVDLITFLAAQLLEVAELNMVLDQFGSDSCRIKILSEYLGTPVPTGQSEASWFVEQQPQRLSDRKSISIKRQSDTCSNARITDQDKYPLPAGSSLTMRFVREEKFTTSTSPSQLSEGIAPDAIGVTLNFFEAVMQQYGTVIRISDLAELTARHPIVQRSIYLLGLQAAETLPNYA